MRLLIRSIVRSDTICIDFLWNVTRIWKFESSLNQTGRSVPTSGRTCTNKWGHIYCFHKISAVHKFTFMSLWVVSRNWKSFRFIDYLSYPVPVSASVWQMFLVALINNFFHEISWMVTSSTCFFLSFFFSHHDPRAAHDELPPLHDIIFPQWLAVLCHYFLLQHY